jgi:hypothetical protein
MSLEDEFGKPETPKQKANKYFADLDKLITNLEGSDDKIIDLDRIGKWEVFQDAYIYKVLMPTQWSSIVQERLDAVESIKEQLDADVRRAYEEIKLRVKIYLSHTSTEVRNLINRLRFIECKREDQDHALKDALKNGEYRVLTQEERRFLSAYLDHFENKHINLMLVSNEENETKS